MDNQITNDFEQLGLFGTSSKPVKKVIVESVIDDSIKKFEQNPYEFERTYEFRHIATCKPHALQVRRAYQTKLVNDNAMANLMQENDKNGQYNGYLSDATKRQIKKNLDNWLLSMKYTNGLKNPMKISPETIFPTFLTLTLPSKQVHSDLDIKNKILDPFIEWLRKTFKVTAYFWRAESQKNGDAHFHLIIDRYIPYGEIRRKWNITTNRLKYVDIYAQMQKFKYRYGYKVTKEEINEAVLKLENICKYVYKTRSVREDINEELRPLLFRYLNSKRTVSHNELVKIAENVLFNAYQKGVKCGWKNPPSTEIKSIKGIASVTAYITKYVTKDGKKALIKGEKIEKRDGKDVVIGKKIEVVNGESYEFETEKPVEFETRKIAGRIWGCSDTLRNQGIDYFKQDIAYEISWMNKKTLQFERSISVTDENIATYVNAQINEADRVIDLDFIKIIPSRKPLADGMPVEVLKKYKNHYKNVYSLIYGKTD